MNTIAGSLALLCLSLCFPTAAAGPPSAAEFASRPDYARLQISPDGSHVAVITEVDDEQGLLVIRLADKAIVGRFTLGLGGAIARYWWVGPKRLVVSGAIRYGSLDEPQPIGELIGVDADGGNRSYLFGYRAPIGAIKAYGNKGRGLDLRDRDEVATIIDPRPEDPQNAVIEVHRYGSGGELGKASAEQLDVYTGARNKLALAPVAGHGAFLTDQRGAVRFVVVRDVDTQTRTWVRNDNRSDWQLLNTGALADADIAPLRFSSDGRAYLGSNEKHGLDCLYEQDLTNGAKRELSCDEVADLTAAVFSFDDQQPIAAVYEPDKPRLHYLSDHPDRLLLEKIQNSFPGKVALPISASRDGRRIILVVYSDRDPGRYFLFDRDQEKATFLLAARQWVDPEAMAERRPIVFAARDGTPLHGYLTLPPAGPEQALPMVTLPHGGPFGVRDDWSWDTDAQWLAAHGYAVLQVNFRGSGGYGRDHQLAGRQGWDSVMIDDLTDGTRWAVGKGIADPDRLAIFGASYGGYAALMSAVREPDLYRCVVDYAGVSDLKTFSKDSDIASSAAGRNFIGRFIGSTADRLKAASPLTMIDRLKAPVFIVHGEEDRRVPFSQATALRKALIQRQHPHEWMAKKGEGHGFFKPENREEFLTRLVAFLDQHLKVVDATAEATAQQAP